MTNEPSTDTQDLNSSIRLLRVGVTAAAIFSISVFLFVGVYSLHERGLPVQTHIKFLVDLTLSGAIMCGIAFLTAYRLLKAGMVHGAKKSDNGEKPIGSF